MTESKEPTREALEVTAETTARSADDTKPVKPTKRNRGGAPRGNRNALKTGRHATKTKPEDMGFAAKKNAEKSAKLAAWTTHVRRVRREGRELLKAWNLNEDGASKVLAQEMTRQRLILHRLDERNLKSLGSGGGLWIREQCEAARVVATFLARLLDRAKEHSPPPPKAVYVAKFSDGTPFHATETEPPDPIPEPELPEAAETEVEEPEPKPERPPGCYDDRPETLDHQAGRARRFAGITRDESIRRDWDREVDDE